MKLTTKILESIGFIYEPNTDTWVSLDYNLRYSKENCKNKTLKDFVDDLLKHHNNMIWRQISKTMNKMMGNTENILKQNIRKLCEYQKNN